MDFKVVLIVLVALAVLDFLWMGFVMQKFYVAELAPIGRIEGGRFDVVYWAAGVVYVLLAIGVGFFVLPKLTVADSLITAFFYGGMFGLVVYGVYDFTNVAILKDWGLLVTAADVAWGGFSVGASTAIGHWIQSNILS